MLLKEYRNAARQRDWVVIRRDLGRRLNDEADFAIAVSDDLKRRLRSCRPRPE